MELSHFQKIVEILCSLKFLDAPSLKSLKGLSSEMALICGQHPLWRKYLFNKYAGRLRIAFLHQVFKHRFSEWYVWYPILVPHFLIDNFDNETRAMLWKTRAGNTVFFDMGIYTTAPYTDLVTIQITNKNHMRVNAQMQIHLSDWTATGRHYQGLAVYFVKLGLQTNFNPMYFPDIMSYIRLIFQAAAAPPCNGLVFFMGRECGNTKRSNHYLAAPDLNHMRTRLNHTIVFSSKTVAKKSDLL